MTDFMIQFLLCNLYLSGIIGILLLVKRLFQNILSARMQYHLWFLLLGLLTVPFLPLRLLGLSHTFSCLASLLCRRSLMSYVKYDAGEAMSAAQFGNMDWLNDFTLSVSLSASPITGSILLGIWLAGILVMSLFLLKSFRRFQTLKQSALPLQNPQIRRLYQQCLDELKITRTIPIYSAAFLKSPAIAGILRPRIYFPIHLISDYSISDYNKSGFQTAWKESDDSALFDADRLQPIRYMLLHELKHYQHRDALANGMIVLARIIYWFNPMVWLALKEMQIDRETACDTSVLKMLNEESYKEYGTALIDFAEQISHSSIPFAVSLGGSMEQMKRRIINIASYEKPTRKKTFAGITAFLLITVLLLTLVPILSTNAADNNRYQWKIASRNISYVDFSSYFGDYDGSFVLYNLKLDSYSIYNMERALLRRSPDSTYKIYDALFGLEAGIITPDDSQIAWSGTHYPFQEWNTDQTLSSAMQSSVNWYFQEIDSQLGPAFVKKYIQETGYGNQDTASSFPSYWLESSLQISPIEQVEQLVKFYHNAFGFQPEHINAVKDAICLSSSATGRFYGKTGTGRINGSDVNGWFVGYVENADNTYFFAVNLEADAHASGTDAAEITMSILSDMEIWS